MDASSHNYITPAGSDELKYFLEFAATTIQRHWRGYRVRQWYLAQKHAAVRYGHAYQQARQQAATYDVAARIIQRVWLGYRNKRIYLYYRDLIQFRERGDPKELLRSINPREAQLADAAAGIHVRFRLGGTVFPPLVFYKIFTHRPVTDICSFCPRNYAQEVRETPKQLHNKAKKSFGADFELEASLRQYIRPDGTLGWRSTCGWYERAENNGWRPISERILVDKDAVTTMTRLKKTPFFHHNPGVRREERVRRAKQKKREWMVRMYREGLQGPGHGAVHLPGSDPADMDDADLNEMDPQIDELLDWSQHLDFNSYLTDWTSMACTLGSEAFVPEPEATTLSEIPSQRVDIRATLNSAGCPLQPFKGGATPAAGATSGLNIS